LALDYRQLVYSFVYQNIKFISHRINDKISQVKGKMNLDKMGKLLFAVLVALVLFLPGLIDE